MLCEYFFGVLFTFPPFYLPFSLISGDFIVYFVQYFMYFACCLYYRSSGHVVSECWFALGNIHFHGELIHLFTYTGIVITIYGFPLFFTQNSLFHRIF